MHTTDGPTDGRRDQQTDSAEKGGGRRLKRPRREEGGRGSKKACERDRQTALSLSLFLRRLRSRRRRRRRRRLCAWQTLSLFVCPPRHGSPSSLRHNLLLPHPASFSQRKPKLYALYGGGGDGRREEEQEKASSSASSLHTFLLQFVWPCG